MSFLPLYIIYMFLSVSIDSKDLSVRYCILFPFKLNKVPGTWYIDQANELILSHVFFQFMFSLPCQQNKAAANI